MQKNVFANKKKAKKSESEKIKWAFFIDSYIEVK